MNPTRNQIVKMAQSIFTASLFWAAVAVADESAPPAETHYPAHELRMVETKPEIYVGDTLLLRVEDLVSGDTARPNREYNVDLKSVAKAVEDSGFVITELQDRPQFKSNEYWLAVVPVKSGKLKLPIVPIVKRDEQSTLEPFQTQPVEFEVRTVLANQDPNQKAVDYRGPLAIRMPWYVLAFLLAVVALAIFGIYKLWNRRRRPMSAAVAPAKPLLPEDQEAVAALTDLQQKNFVVQGKFKPHYFGASDILKRYLGRRYSIDAVEATTSELVRLLRESPLVEASIVTTLKSLFERMDRVKFTDQAPAIEEANHLVLECQNIIDRTKRVVLAEESGEKGKVS